MLLLKSDILLFGFVCSSGSCFSVYILFSFCVTGTLFIKSNKVGGCDNHSRLSNNAHEESLSRGKGPYSKSSLEKRQS